MPKPPSPLGSYPTTRMRRNRRDDWNRRLVAENRLTVDDLLWPVFVHDGGGSVDVPSMPGQARLSIDLLVAAVTEARDLGIPMIAIFPAIDDALKTPAGDDAVNPDNLV